MTNKRVQSGLRCFSTKRWASNMLLRQSKACNLNSTLWGSDHLQNSASCRLEMYLSCPFKTWPNCPSTTRQIALRPGSLSHHSLIRERSGNYSPPSGSSNFGKWVNRVKTGCLNSLPPTCRPKSSSPLSKNLTNWLSAVSTSLFRRYSTRAPAKSKVWRLSATKKLRTAFSKNSDYPSGTKTCKRSHSWQYSSALLSYQAQLLTAFSRETIFAN